MPRQGTLWPVLMEQSKGHNTECVLAPHIPGMCPTRTGPQCDGDLGT